MLRNSQVAKDLIVSNRLIKKASDLLARIDHSIEKDDRETLVKELFEYEDICEKIVNNARLLPVISGIPKGKEKVEDAIIIENKVEVGYTQEGWFFARIPSLLPKKEKGDPSFIRATLNASMTRYFKQNDRVKYEESCVLIFEHNYAKERSEREYRDHDNIELNAVVDMIALHVLVDDTPLRCRHYYCSKVAETDFTAIYVVPVSQFIDWLNQN